MGNILKYFYLGFLNIRAIGSVEQQINLAWPNEIVRSHFVDKRNWISILGLFLPYEACFVHTGLVNFYCLLTSNTNLPGDLPCVSKWHATWWLSHLRYLDLLGLYHLLTWSNSWPVGLGGYPPGAPFYIFFPRHCIHIHHRYVRKGPCFVTPPFLSRICFSKSWSRDNLYSQLVL